MPGDGSEGIRAASVTHRYGKTVALDQVDLTIPVGSIAAFIGPDGVGKSTLLGLIAGVRRLQTGEVRVLGGDMGSRMHRDAIAPRIAYLPQGLGRNLYPTLSVVENIDFFGRLYGQTAKERRKKIARLIEVTGLDQFPDRPAGKLSGGMKQKLGLCCTLIHDPDLLILDEPTTGVDPLSRRQFWELIRHLRDERPRLTTLVATAYMEEAERFGHIVAMDEGRILACGGTSEILAQMQSSGLEQAYVALQRPERRGNVAPLVIPALSRSSDVPAIAAENLTMRFGNFTAVDHVSFRIETGEIFGFIGPNGCGKTTTMKMLTGLLPMSEGRAELLGRPVDARDVGARLRVGYVSQSFSLYEELSVRANLELHGRLFRVSEGELDARVATALDRFDLDSVSNDLPSALPLGMRQRLQLAAACLHQPEVLILDEPTSGVDPAARGRFWRLLVEMSRRDGVTIFISTHFMNEAERCDRVSLMHSGRVLAVGSPADLCKSRNAPSLEEAFIAYIQETASLQGSSTAGSGFHTTGTGQGTAANVESVAPATPSWTPASIPARLSRTWAFARREATELLRDPVRLAFALLGPLLLLTAFGFGISFDIERLPFAVLDRDQSYESRIFLEQLSDSKYFVERGPLHDEFEIDRRLRSGELRFVVSIPPSFGRDLLQHRQPQVSFWLQGGDTFPAETARAYIEGVALKYAADRQRRLDGRSSQLLPIDVEPRFHYNQDFRSVFAMIPGTIMLLLVVFPAMLTALAIVREKELGSITNVYASPATVGEYLVGKQTPYIAIGFASYLSLLALSAGIFGIVPKGPVAALSVAAFLYVFAATAFGLLISAFVSTQVAAIYATSIATAMTAAHYSGFLFPASSLEGMGRIMGLAFPSLWFQIVDLGVFAKGLGLGSFGREVAILLGFGLFFMLFSRMFVRKQGA